jgi:peptidoglycan/LPS O-acetylase OafA/YrhL
VAELTSAGTGGVTTTSAGATAPAAARKPVDRLNTLTGMRFAAAVLVFLYHSSLFRPDLRLMSLKSSAFTHWHDWAAPLGGQGVAFFFTLSGFVLTWSSRTSDTSRAFWRRRLVKILPDYVITWALAGFLFAFAITPGFTATINLLMVAVWVPTFSTGYSMDPVSWSLGVEVFFYLLFPLLVIGVRRIPLQQLKYWIGATILAIMAVPLIAYTAFSSKPYSPVGPFSEAQYYFAYVCPAPRLLEFVLGMLLALAVKTGHWPRIGLGWSVLTVVAGYALALNTPFLWGQTATCIIPIVLMIAATARADVAGRRTVLSGKTWVWLGNISFAFYLLHFLVLRQMRTELGHHLYSAPQAAGILAVSMAISIALSSLLYVLVERPIVRRFSNARRRPAAAAAPAIS